MACWSLKSSHKTSCFWLCCGLSGPLFGHFLSNYSTLLLIEEGDFYGKMKILVQKMGSKKWVFWRLWASHISAVASLVLLEFNEHLTRFNPSFCMRDFCVLGKFFFAFLLFKTRQKSQTPHTHLAELDPMLCNFYAVYF